MIILPAIDLKDGQCVRLFQGDYETVEIVANDPVETARLFEKQGARWLHMVDLDGAKDGRPANAEVVFQVRDSVDMHIELGGGIRDMETVEFYLDRGIDRVILGSAALHNPKFVEEAIRRYGKKIAVGIDAKDGKVAVDGWLDTSEVDYIELAKKIDQMGCSYIIVTDIAKDGTMNGPNLVMLDRINQEIQCNVVASGGVSSLLDIINLHDLGLYGAIAGRSLYNGALDLGAAVVAAQRLGNKRPKNSMEVEDNLERYFKKAELLPAIIQEAGTKQVLMLAYMNLESLEKSVTTGYTWFYSRSRKTLWNKGETSGNTQKIRSIRCDCDDDTLLIEVEQKGAACHTGSHTCFFKEILKRG